MLQKSYICMKLTLCMWYQHHEWENPPTDPTSSRYGPASTDSTQWESCPSLNPLIIRIQPSSNDYECMQTYIRHTIIIIILCAPASYTHSSSFIIIINKYVYIHIIASF